MINTSPLEAIEYADGQILSYSAQGGSLTLILKDWQEKERTLIFKGVSGLCDLGVIGFDLSHCKVSNKGIFTQKLKNIHEDKEEYYSLDLWIADYDEEPLFTVAFQAFEIE